MKAIIVLLVLMVSYSFAGDIYTSNNLHGKKVIIYHTNSKCGHLLRCQSVLVFDSSVATSNGWKLCKSCAHQQLPSNLPAPKNIIKK